MLIVLLMMCNIEVVKANNYMRLHQTIVNATRIGITEDQIEKARKKAIRLCKKVPNEAMEVEVEDEEEEDE